MFLWCHTRQEEDRGCFFGVTRVTPSIAPEEGTGGREEGDEVSGDGLLVVEAEDGGKSGLLPEIFQHDC